MSWFVSPWVYPICSSLGFLDLGVYFLSHFREFFNYNLLKYFLMPFPFVFWDPCNSKCWVLNVVSEVSETILITFFFFFSLRLILFFFMVFWFSYFHQCIFQLTYLLLSQLLYCWFPPVYFYSQLFIVHYCLFFNSSRSSLNISYILFICVSSFFICASNFTFKILDHFYYHYSEFFFR